MERYINACELGSWIFCRRSWHLARLNVLSQAEPQREAGLAWHQAHEERVATATHFKNLARAFAIALLVILLILLYRIAAS
jgi:hypothetical protein